MTPYATLFFLVAAVLAILAVPLVSSPREFGATLRHHYGRANCFSNLFTNLILSELGTVVVTYAYPIIGVTAPTTTQMSGLSLLTCQVSFADADTTATITHNMQLSAAALARLEPLVVIYQNTGGTPAPLLAVTLATNTIVLSKQSTTAGTGGTVTVQVQRPHSIIAPNY